MQVLLDDIRIRYHFPDWGILIFLLGPDKIRRILDWYEGQSTVTFRVIAMIVLVFGMVIIFSA